MICLGVFPLTKVSFLGTSAFEQYVNSGRDVTFCNVSQTSKTVSSHGVSHPKPLALSVSLRDKPKLIIDVYDHLLSPPANYCDLLGSFGVSSVDYSAFVSGFIGLDCPNCGVLFLPSVRGGCFNPVVMARSVKNGAHSQFKKLVGLPFAFDVSHLVLTFPKSFSKRYAVDPSSVKREAWAYFKEFKEHLPSLMGLPDGVVVGCSASLHFWQSKSPFGSPHLHFHVIVPHFGLSYKFSEAKRAEFAKVHARLVALDQSKLDVPIEESLDKRFKKHVGFVMAKPSKHLLPDGSAKLAKNGLPVKYVFHDYSLKRVWGSIIGVEAVDVHIKGIWGNDKAFKGKLLHELRYKSRPALLDVAKHLDSNPSYVAEPSRWSEHLVFTKTDTRVFGFWRYLSSLRSFVEPVVEDGKVCPVCGELCALIKAVDLLVLAKGCVVCENDRGVLRPLCEVGEPPPLIWEQLGVSVEDLVRFKNGLGWWA